jgi:hypothetical protein
MTQSLFFLTFFFCSSFHLFGQDNIRFSPDSDTAFWYAYKNSYVKDFKLGLIEPDTAKYVFRFWSNGLIIKLTKSNNNYSGEIIRFVEQYPAKSKKNIFVKKNIILPEVADKALEPIDSLKINELPSDKNIKGWQQGFDGITYFIEYKVDSRYSFKNYWTPSSQDSLAEAQLLLTFISSLESLLDLKNSSKVFQNEIPFDSWTYPGNSNAVLRVKSKGRTKKNGG